MSLYIKALGYEFILRSRRPAAKHPALELAPVLLPLLMPHILSLLNLRDTPEIETEESFKQRLDQQEREMTHRRVVETFLRDISDGLSHVQLRMKQLLSAADPDANEDDFPFPVQPSASA